MSTKNNAAATTGGILDPRRLSGSKKCGVCHEEIYKGRSSPQGAASQGPGAHLLGNDVFRDDRDFRSDLDRFYSPRVRRLILARHRRAYSAWRPNGRLGARSTAALLATFAREQR